MSNIIRPQVDGPLMVAGDIELIDAQGASVVISGKTIRLCRCGQSANKPYCDGTHRKAGFDDDARVCADYVIRKPEAGDPGAHLRLTPRTNGPVHCFGAMTIVADDGSEWHGEQANLCRCGQSGNKPFCDGTHRHCNFSAP
ncbi:MAG: CDGSH iron-sulfur domain-containing protein [Burkholderiales bacterium]|jgi:CDGSH-type Zn-finger protein